MNDNFLALKTGVPKIIKRANQKNAASTVFRSLIKHQILDAEAEARGILQAARDRAEETENAAQMEAETIRRESYRAGREDAERELLDNLFEIKEKRAQVLRTIEEDVLKLSVKLAEKIVGREIEQSDGAARGEIVVNALRAARQQEMLTVRVNANDLPLLEQMRDEKNNAFGRAQFIDFVADQSVKDGGCIVESSSGTIDARIETQLRILENVLLARVSGEK